MLPVVGRRESPKAGKQKQISEWLKARCPGEAQGGFAELVVFNLHFPLWCLEPHGSVLSLCGLFLK